MAPSETSDPKTARPEHLNTEETEENNLKIIFLKMVEVIKKKTKKNLLKKLRKIQT